MIFKQVTGILSITGMLLAVPAQAEDLVQVFRMALDSDPDYRAAAATRDAAYVGKDLSKANFYPGVNLQYRNSKTDTGSYDTSNGPEPARSSDSSGYSLTLSQSIFNRRNSVLEDQADIDALKADNQYAEAKQKLILKVAQRYFDVVSAMDNVAFSEAEKKAVARQLEQTKQRFDVGLVAITDVHEAQAQYDQSVAQGIMAETRLASARESLRALTGQYNQQLARLSRQAPLLNPSPDDIDTWTSMAMKQNQEIIAAQYNIDRQKESLALARADFYPTLDLNLSHSVSDDVHYNQGVESTTPDSTVISLSVNYNIYNGGYASANTKKAQLDLTAAKERLEAARRNTQNTVRNAYLNVIANISRVQALNQAVVSSESALKATEAGFEVGTRTTVDVLQSRRQLFSAKNEHTNARYDYVLSMLVLKQSAGSLGEADLAELNRWLDQ
ncbi:MAG: TolC family outer membrane protein [Gammaproteobacteria bacterium]|nr:TolC family outer membrane protein [Gammaproteobacteria bacterium]MDH5801764.1 TolC family outer membrane protein [Gammaproteobacteria bacterium]